MSSRRKGAAKMSSNRLPPKGGPKGMPPKKLDKGVFKRVIKLLFKSFSSTLSFEYLGDIIFLVLHFI